MSECPECEKVAGELRDLLEVIPRVCRVHAREDIVQIRGAALAQIELWAQKVLGRMAK